MKPCTLVIDIHNWWQPGTGRGSGAHLDALAHTDADGVPELPGRTVKGLLRDAMERAQALGWIEGDLARQLFGHSGSPDEPFTEPGVLRISSARLPDAERRWLACTDGEAASQHLFSELASTAIDTASGTAQSASLRAIQVVLPLKLRAEIVPMPGSDIPNDWSSALEQCLPLIRSVGSGRSRGLGRATLSLETKS